MIQGIGIDIVELNRIQILNERKPAFKQRILTPAELEQYDALNTRLNRRRQIEYLAGRFAAKEAFAKALGTGIGADCGWHDVEVLSHKQGPPRISWRKQSPEMVIHLSISHSSSHAVAQVVIETFSSSMSS